MELPGPEQAVDARTGFWGFPAEGPFERDFTVSADDVDVSVFPSTDDVPPGQPPLHRLVACVDIRPSHVAGVALGRGDVIVLDVQPIGDAPAVPLVLDAVTGERLPIDASRMLDEANEPCDGRLRRRRGWDDNLRRLHKSRSH